MASVFQSQLYIKIICFCPGYSNEEPPLHSDGMWHIDGMFERDGCSSLPNQVSIILASGRCTYDAISTDSIAVRTEHLRYPQNICHFFIRTLLKYGLTIIRRSSDNHDDIKWFYSCILAICVYFIGIPVELPDDGCRGDLNVWVINDIC